MQLKTIKLSGFKSFAEKTKIELQKGVTIVVGPNGSGKSNIIEAVRWVLGEQSAKILRGQKMGDVIFSGAQQKSAMNLAQVSLLFDNSDHYLDSPYTELEVTRKIFRNGESWYGINGQECRLKDITSMFMDSGLGADGFSIISQGNVEEVFNSTAESRRSIVETVAGIFQYKQQKKTAEAKIAKIEDNLTRVNDIIFELAERLPELSKQKDVAEDYLNQRAKLTKLMKQRELGNWQQLTINVKELKNKITTLRQDSDHRQAVLKTHQQRIQATKLALANQKQTIAKQTDHVQQLSQTANELKSAIQLNQQEQKFQKQNKADLEQQKTQMKHQLQDLTTKFAEIEEQLLSNQSQQREHQQQLTQLNAKLSSLNQDGPQVLAQLHAKYVDLIKQQSTLKEQQGRKQQLLDQKKRELSELQLQNGNLETKLAGLKNQYQKLLGRESELKKCEKQQNKQLAEQAKLQDGLASQYKKQQEVWLTHLKELEALKGRLAYQQQNEYRPFYQGVTNLMHHQQQFEGVYGPVASFIETQDQYTLAIETALGGRLQNVIVDTDATAQKIVEWLTTEQLGRVTFLPVDGLNKVRSKKISSALTKIDGFLGSAENLVNFPTQFSSIKTYLLANILVSTDLKAAINLSKASKRSFKVVSLDGQIVNPGGAITGGKNAKSRTNLLNSKKVTQQLQSSVANKQMVVEESEKAVRQVQQQLDELKSKAKTLQEAHLKNEHQLDQLQDQLRTNQTSTEQVSSQLAQNQDKQRELKLSSPKVQSTDSESLEQKLVSLKRQIGNQERQNNSESLQRNQILEQSTAIQQKMAQLKAQAEYLNSSKQDISNQLVEVRSTVNKLASQVDKMANELDGSKESKLKNQLDQVTTQKYSAGELKQQLEIEQQRLQTELANNTELVGQLKLELTRADSELQVLLNKYTEQQKNKKHSQQILTDQFNYSELELEQLSLQKLPDNISNQVRLLEKGIEELGPVNVGAIEEFNKVAQRNDFLTEQRDDLSYSLQELKDTIAVMDQESTHRFLTTFTQLADSFETVFQQLFGGGKAKLELTDPKHPLTTGIEIMAMPPGKKYRSMSLLSGGERTLTAIALLFAILKIKPVPFVILDEAEAALDPINVERFAKYVKQFATKTQFVVVTHRKETMVYADQLYGVTMQNSGVSKVVSIALQTDNEVKK